MRTDSVSCSAILHLWIEELTVEGQEELVRGPTHHAQARDHNDNEPDKSLQGVDTSDMYFQVV